LSQSALVNNIDFIRSQIGTDVRISSVVKGNAYGHGIRQFVPMVEKAGIDHFSVFSANEASAVKESAENHPEIMIMGWLDNAELEWAVKSGISFWIFDPERLDHAIAISKKSKQKARIHLEIETGMNRTGLDDTELEYVIKTVLDNAAYLDLEGICTHYAGAESISNFVRVHRQISRFNKTYKKITQLGLKPKIRHTASSAAAMSYPRTRMDMVRIGIMQYGLWPSVESLIQYLHGKSYNHDPLSRVIAWKSKVMSLKNVQQGEFVSYGTTYLATEPKRIAVVPVGYSHGYSRMLSNQGRVLIRGQRIAVIGMVNMNMFIADVTNIPEVKIGDEVVIIGRQEDLEISVASFSEISAQVNYELLARLPMNTSREVVN